MRKLLNIVMILSFFAIMLSAKDDVNDKKNSLAKTGLTSDIWLNANRMNGVFRNNGIWHYDVVAGNWGLEWPKGSGNSPIFAGGQMIGAVVNGDIKVAGIQHSATEYQPGIILSDGTASNPKDAAYKWYELRSGGVGDWTNWPFDQGAPYDDANGNGQYDAGESPLLIGDQTIFSVWNDLAAHLEYSTAQLGVEVRQTAFAFNRADALGDMQFIKWQMVNKSGEDWDSTYFSIWLDPDLGGASDDLVGCDTTLGLGYTYNAVNEDQTYGAAPPAQGIDFFQGPIIDEVGSTVTLPDGTVLMDKKMLRMTSFVFYNNTSDPVNGNPDSGQDMWNFFRSIWRNGQPITYGGRGVDPTADRAFFMFPGDPETEQGTGWLDSEADDRRFLMTTGPFEMPAWSDENGNGMPDFGEPGVQEIVAGIIMARGNSNLNSVTVLKTVDNLAQLAYDLNFNLAKSPLPPAVVVSEDANSAVLTWDETSEFNEDGTDYESVDPIVDQAVGDTVIIDNVVQEITDSDYNFYGYTLYQYSDASGADPVTVDHWDIGEQESASPYTAQRFYRLTVNKHNMVGEVGAPLINGKEYYFGVVAEGFLAFGAPKILQSPPTIVTVIPRHTVGAKEYSAYNDTLTVTHTGLSDGATVVWVVDPTKTTGMGYTVDFNADLTWNLVNSMGDTVAKNQTNQAGDDAYNVYDGLLVKVQGPSPGINFSAGDREEGWQFQGNRWISGTNWGGRALFGGLDNGADFWGPTDLAPSDYTDVELLWAGATDRSDLSAAALAAASMAEYPERWSKAVVYRRDLGYTLETTLGDVPFALYDTWADPPRRLKIAFIEDANNGVANLLWDMGWDGAEFAANGGREYTFLLNDTYDTDYTDYLNGTLDPANNNNNLMYAFWPASRSREYLIDPFEMQIFGSRVNAADDKYTFTAPAKQTRETADIKADMKKIKVVPNPYYGYHSGELDPFHRWVQFTNLPDVCTIRIFDLAGNLVQKLEKNDATSPFMQWNLKNLFDLPVASGIYVFHVDSDKYGEKIGKLAIFTPAERLDTY